MPSLCYECGVQVDALRTPSRVVGARVVSLCGDCARGVRPRASDTLVAAGELAPRAPASALPLPRPRPRARMMLLPAGVAIVAGASLLGWLGRGVFTPRRAPAPPAPVVTVHNEPTLLVPVVVTVPGAAPTAEPRPRAARRQPAIAIAAAATVIPIAGADHVEPSPNGYFGAERPGLRPEQCGEGHCGIDLRAPEGTPVVAARSGAIAVVSRDADGRGGRWIEVDHGDGLATFYFHLAKIRDDLAPGTPVHAGESLGTVGRTGVHNSPTHLHFAVAVAGDYVDPMPFVRDARPAQL